MHVHIGKITGCNFCWSSINSIAQSLSPCRCCWYQKLSLSYQHHYHLPDWWWCHAGCHGDIEGSPLNYDLYQKQELLLHERDEFVWRVHMCHRDYILHYGGYQFHCSHSWNIHYFC